MGQALPNYVLINYFAISRKFPAIEIWLLVDSKNNYEKLLKSGVRAWLVSCNDVSVTSNKFNYRNGFWVNTTRRFFAMQEFHRANPELSLLQIESDVIISKEFPFHMFGSIKESLAFPMSSPDIGLASTLWCKSPQATDLLANFTIECLSENPNLTDTDILGLLANANPSEVLILRSGLDEKTIYRDIPGGRSRTLRGSIHPINNLGIFDASTIGIHLCGSDPRNSFGFSKVFDPLKHHFMDLSLVKFIVRQGEIFVQVPGEERVVYSLHNHSKNSIYFSGNFGRVLSKYLPRRQKGEFYNFSLLGLLLCLRDYNQLLINKFKLKSLRFR